MLQMAQHGLRQTQSFAYLTQEDTTDKDLFNKTNPSHSTTSRSATWVYNTEYYATNNSRYNLPRNNSTRIPPSGYRCVVCLRSNHFFKNCPEDVNQRAVGLTPYQGNKICFGKFKCPKCKRKWISSSSWANHGQDCVKCKITVMPHKQWPVERENEIPKVSQHHPERLCELCKRLGHSCRSVKTT